MALCGAATILVVALLLTRLGATRARVRTAVLLLAGGHIGIAGSLLWSVLLGCAAGMTLVALRTPPTAGALDEDEETEITIRGPLSYAGPGSLGGTESALRR